MRVNDGISLGQLIADLVVVGNDERNAELLCSGGLLNGRNAVIDRNYQLDSALGKLLDGGDIQPVALGEPVGHISYHIRSPRLEI